MWDVFIDYVLPSLLTLLFGLALPILRRVLKLYERKLVAEGKKAEDDLRYVIFDEAIDFVEELDHRKRLLGDHLASEDKEYQALAKARVRLSEAGLSVRDDDRDVLAARVQRSRKGKSNEVPSGS